MSCFLKECQNFFCEKCQVLYFLFVHLRLTDGYISVFQIEAKRWMPFPLGFRAHSALPVLYSVFLISLPIFSGAFLWGLCLPDAGDQFALLGKPIIHRLHSSTEPCLFFFVQLCHLNACCTQITFRFRLLLRPEPALHLGALPGTQAMISG